MPESQSPGSRPFNPPHAGNSLNVPDTSPRSRTRQCGRARSSRRNGSWSLPRRRLLHLIRADVDTAVHHAIKTGTALVIEGRLGETRIACINGRAAGQQRMGQGRPTVVLQRAEHRVGVSLVPWAGQEVTAAIIGKVVSKR
jgi:hypothetical protein